MSIQNIYNLLRNAGLNHIGTCALMGNMKAESGMVSNIAQRGMTRLTDDEYTRRADQAAGESEQNQYFIKDAVGYGLAQWTYFSRKRGLLNFAKYRGTSVGDETTQVLYAIQELQVEYAGVWNTLLYTNDLYNATAIVCTQYERPAVNNINARYSFAQEFMNLTIAHEAEAEKPTANDNTVLDDNETHFEAVWPPRAIQRGKCDGWPEIALMRAVLRCRGYVDEVNDAFDEELENAIKNFQHDSGFRGNDVDGIAGKMTWKKALEI